jgi:UDP-3-O-[3-hydroxymyristoyl] glucosamine N-acyltransferase
MTKEISIAELASTLKGKVVGNLDRKVKISGTCAIDMYVSGKVSFVRNQKYGELLAKLQNAVVFIPESLADLCEKYPQNIYIVVEDVVNSLMDVQDFFYEEQFIIAQEGISPTAKVDGAVRLGESVYIGENVYVGKGAVIGDRTKILHNSCIFDNVVIKDDTCIYPSVCIYRNSEIGSDCIIHSGVRIGVDGFRFEQDIERKMVRKISHVGGVVVGSRVEIGANCTVDRATFEDDDTILFDDVKLDDQVHIGHNAKIGARTCIAAQTCISGSVKIGEDVWIGAGVSISNGVNVGNRAKLLLNAVVAYDVAEGEMVSGFYAMPHRRWKQVYRKLKEEI